MVKKQQSSKKVFASSKAKLSAKKNPKNKIRTLGDRRSKMLTFVAIVVVLILGYYLKQEKRAVLLPKPPESALYKQLEVPIEVRVQDLLSRMTLDEKLGQMALVEKNSLRNLNDTASYAIGGVLSGAGAKPTINTPEGWFNMVTDFEISALRSRLEIPLLYGIDAVHGHANIPGATVFPHMIGLGASGDEGLVSRVAKATAEELRATNINWSYSPTFDAPKDIRWGRTYEAFSDDRGLISKLGVAYINGLQQKDSVKAPSVHVLATAKHFLGTGAMVWGKSDNKDFKIDQGKTEANDYVLNEEYLAPFVAASNAGVSSIMIGLHKYGDQTLITNEYLITQKLKQEIGFKGFVVSDWYGVYERAGNKYRATVKAVNAGIDMVMLPYDYSAFIGDMKKAIKRGDITQERVDDAVTRIVRQKFIAGLFDAPIHAADNLNQIGSTEHRTIAREAVAKSAVLLKNDQATLPLLKTASAILVAGSGANNVGRQSGAWTVEWQGIDGNWLPSATSILQGIRDHVSTATQVTYDLNGYFKNGTKAPIGIAVVSEKPYAEGWGDNPNPTISSNDLAAITRLQSISDKVIVVIISGRPLILNSQEKKWDALVAAWLPGSEGSGVADVLFGDTPFTGKLPLPWPASTTQLPIATSGSTADGTNPTYPRGHGL